LIILKIVLIIEAPAFPVETRHRVLETHTAMYTNDEKVHMLYLGQKLRKLRKEQNLTQLDLAQQVGITNGQVSTIERGVSSPSLATLHRIARALNVPMHEFFEDERNKEVELLRKGKGRKVANTRENASIEILLARSNRGAFNVLFLKLESGELRLSPRPSVPEEYYLYVLRGKCEIRIQGDDYLLDPGDSIFVKAQKEQSIRNVGGDELRLLLVTKSEMIAPEVRSLLASSSN
jgi:transcriptional regulator with XRE-family HTH domain